MKKAITALLILGTLFASQLCAQDSLGVHKAGEMIYLNGANHVAINGSYAYLTDPAIGLLILDVSDPIDPILIANQPLPSAWGICMRDSLAVIVGSGLTTVSIVQPTAPEILGQVGTWDGLDVVVQDDYAFVASHFGGLIIVDISNPITPEVVSQFGGTAKSIAISDNYAYLAGESGFVIVDISQPGNPILTGYYPCHAQSVDVQGGFAYVGVSDAGFGFVVFDISNPGNPTVVGVLQDIAWINNIEVIGDLAYIGGSEDGGDQCGFWILDVSNPTAIVMCTDPLKARQIYAAFVVESCCSNSTGERYPRAECG